MCAYEKAGETEEYEWIMLEKIGMKGIRVGKKTIVEALCKQG